MQFLTTSLAALSLAQVAIGAPREILPRATGALDSWLATETPYALDGVLSNIGTDGKKVAGANAGVIVASPSKSNPDCKFSFLLYGYQSPNIATNYMYRFLHLDP